MMLDRSKPYAETMGDSVARYHQDGKDFNQHGEEIMQIIADVLAEAEPPKRRGRPPKEKTE